MSRKTNSKGLPPPGKLASVADILTEMARVYRLSHSGRITPEVMTKYIYGLKEMRECIGWQLLEETHGKLGALEARIGVRR